MLGIGFGLLAFASLLNGTACKILAWEYEPVLEELERVPIPDEQLVAYRVNPAAFASYRVEVRRERPWIPGVLWVETLAVLPTSDVDVTRITPSSFSLSYVPRGSEERVTEVVHVVPRPR